MSTARGSEVSSHLAHNVAELRRARKLAQIDLARLAGMPRSTVTYIESGEGNPSLLNLCRLSSALQVGLEALLAKPRPECVLIAADGVPVETRGPGCRLFKLLPDEVPGMEIDRMEIEPGSSLPGMPHLEHTKEYLTGVLGEVTVHVAGESFVVAPGDVLAFPGNQPHSYRNAGSRRAVCLSVVALAIGGAG